MRPRKKERVRLIDDSQLAISRDRSRSVQSKPDAWFRSDAHKAWVRTLPCCARLSPVHAGAVQAAHVRIGTDGAGGVEPSDYFVNPLCERCHIHVQHKIGERTFHTTFTGYLDPALAALKLALQSPCPKTRAGAQVELDIRAGRASA